MPCNTEPTLQYCYGFYGESTPRVHLCSALLVLFSSSRTPHGGAPPKARGMDAELEHKLHQRLQLQDELPDVQHAVARARVSLCAEQCRHARVSQKALQVHSQVYAMVSTQSSSFAAGV